MTLHVTQLRRRSERGFIVTIMVLMLACPNNGLFTNYRGLELDGSGLCPTDPRNCSCRWYTGSETEIDCPKTDQVVQLRIEPNHYAEVRCQRNRQYEFNQIPQLKIGDTKRLTIDGCPFPHYKTILQFVSFLGISDIKLLWLKNNANYEYSASLEKDHFIGLENLERLAINNAKLTNVQEDLFKHLINLTWLDMRDNMFTLPGTIFDTLPKLRILELNINGLDTLEPRLLQNLSNLRLLTLWHNNLRNLSRKSFMGVPNLERLDLSGNPFELVPQDLFAGLPRLTELAMGQNSFTQLPLRLFQANRELRKFKMAFHRVTLETIPEDFLQNLTALEQVNLERIGVNSLPETMLQGSSNITELNLASNQLKMLPNELLRDQSSLRELLLEHNQLISLPDGLLRNTVELRMLRLSYNQINVLSTRLLRSLIKLEELYLDHNKLKVIEPDAFRQTVALRTLHLQVNQLAFETLNGLPNLTKIGDEDSADVPLPDEFGLLGQEGTPFQHLHRLVELNLAENWLTGVPRDLLLNTHGLQRLNLTRNNFTSLTYANLQFLAPSITVDLRHNSIFEIDLADVERLMRQDMGLNRGEETLVGRTRILLNDNPINCNCIVHAFAQYVQRQLEPAVYERLELVTDALICNSPEHLHGTLVRDVPMREFVCELDTPSTSIRHCPDDCRCLIRPDDAGVIIDCSGLGLTEVPALPRPSSFGYRFIELHLENNNISALPSKGKRTTGWAEVRELYVSNNSIRAVEPDQLPKSLQLLDLSRNQLTEVEVSVMETLPSEAKLRLAHNEWTCKCETAPFVAYALTNQHRIEDFGRIRCTDGSLLAQTTPGDLCIDRTYAIVLACVIISIIACLVALLSFIYYTYRLELKVWLFKHGLCLWLVTEEELDKDKQYDAFISYSHKDEAFITEHLVPTLEREPMSFKLCWHVRDWTPGEMINSQITSSVEQSRRTIIVLSSSFLESLWGQLEFRTAHLQSMAERRNRLIIVIYGDIGNFDKLEPELRAYLHTNTYVRWGDPWFWDKLRYAMPHPHPPKTHSGSGNGGVVATVATGSIVRSGGLFMRQLQAGRIDDRRELIQPQTAPAATPPVLATPPTEPVATPIGTPFTITGNGNTHGVNPYRANGHINGAFVINSNAKQSDV